MDIAVIALILAVILWLLYEQPPPNKPLAVC